MNRRLIFLQQHKPETKEKMRQTHIGEKNPRWKGSDVGYSSLHTWVRKNLPMPELCQICNERPPRNLANITGAYNRDLKNWLYLCIRCHRRFDIRSKKELRALIFGTFPR